MPSERPLARTVFQQRSHGCGMNLRVDIALCTCSCAYTVGACVPCVRVCMRACVHVCARVRVRVCEFMCMCARAHALRTYAHTCAVRGALCARCGTDRVLRVGGRNAQASRLAN